LVVSWVWCELVRLGGARWLACDVEEEEDDDVETVRREVEEYI
jgi:hypothetical protein